MLRRRSRTLVKIFVIVASFLGVVVRLSWVFNPVSDILKRSDVDQVPVPLEVFTPAPVLTQSYIVGLLQTVIPNASVNKKIDWHDYAKIQADANRTGFGEQGLPVILSPEEELEKGALYKVNGFNAYASDKIAFDRSLPDIRHHGCKTKLYEAVLPTVSVVIPFYNEHWSTLLRTTYTVINRSPEHLIKEVILVDDGSTKEHSKRKLDEFLKVNLPKVRVLHSPKRVGLIRARLMGARAATGDVLVFLDSHSEANVNWLPPLLEPIALNNETAVCPFIDIIDYETFAYRAQDEGARGAFDWQLFYKRLPLLPDDLKFPTEPFKNPIMAGGLFAIDRQYFWKLGGYDEGLDIWGGEQYELSFKIWLCGGQLLDAPCSRVGHIYRKFLAFGNPGIGDFVGRNYRRVADVWMDEYAEYIYKRRPSYRKLNAGDISQQKALRERLKCKSFKWFMDNVAFDLCKVYPPVEQPHYAEGEIRNVHSNLCIDTKFHGEKQSFGVDVCIKDNPQASGEQKFVLTWHKDIRPKKRNICFDVSSIEAKAPVMLWNCHGFHGNQLWRYNLDTKWLVVGRNNRCLDCDEQNKQMFVSECNAEKDSQKWTIEIVDLPRLLKWDSSET